MRNKIEQCLLVVLLSLHSSIASAKQEVAVPNSAAISLKPGLDEITESKVTATISFLASDELGGRATGSAEFNIAAKYVASRFLSAGLDGSLANGDFYHLTSKQVVKMPKTVKVTDAEKNPIALLGLLGAASEPLSFIGPLSSIDLTSEQPASSLNGLVTGKMTSNLKGGRFLSQIIRLSSTLKDAGAKALFLEIAPDSELIAMARDAQENAKPESNRGRFAIPVLMVPEGWKTDGEIRVEVPAAIVTDSPMRNVIGLLRGSDPELAKEAILFSAHLDHLGSKPIDGDGIYNGADDDASGVTAVLMLADAFSKMPQPKRTLLFMTFWGEESGLLGSKQFVETPAWPLDKILANVNIEMIGRPEAGARGKIWMTGWQESNLGEVMNRASSPFGVEIFNHPKLSDMLYRSSDNWSFAQKGVIAHSFSAGSLHADYHQPDDEWDRLEIPHMTRVIQGLFAGSVPMAYGESTPMKSK
jgi:hypothetical protein